MLNYSRDDPFERREVALSAGWDYDGVWSYNDNLIGQCDNIVFPMTDCCEAQRTVDLYYRSWMCSGCGSNLGEYNRKDPISVILDNTDPAQDCWDLIRAVALWFGLMEFDVDIEINWKEI